MIVWKTRACWLGYFYLTWKYVFYPWAKVNGWHCIYFNLPLHRSIPRVWWDFPSSKECVRNINLWRLNVSNLKRKFPVSIWTNFNLWVQWPERDVMFPLDVNSRTWKNQKMSDWLTKGGLRYCYMIKLQCLFCRPIMMIWNSGRLECSFKNHISSQWPPRLVDTITDKGRVDKATLSSLRDSANCSIENSFQQYSLCVPLMIHAYIRLWQRVGRAVSNTSLSCAC